MEEPKDRFVDLFNQVNVQIQEHNWSQAWPLFEQLFQMTLDEERQKLLNGRAVLAAEMAVQEGQWQWGRQIYNLLLQREPSHRSAVQGLREIDALERVDEEMRQLIESGDRAFAAGNYGQALKHYNDAKNQTEKARIFKYHAALDQKINRALELRSWQERIQETVASAIRLQRQGELTQALAMLQRLQAELPEEQVHANMGPDINALVDQIKQQVDADVVLREAKKRFQDEDFEGALALVDIPALADNAEANQLKQRCRYQLDQHIKPVLERAEHALQRNAWQEAFDELQYLRQEYPRNPNWRKLWLRVGRKAGEQALEQGREANNERNFQAARLAFETAGRAFERVLEVYPDHTAIPQMRDEAVDLAFIAGNEDQAMRLWRQGDRKAALAHLESAAGRIASAREQQRDYAAVSAVVEAMAKTIRGELESIAEEERRLEDGARQLDNRQFDRAVASFRQALNALLPEHRQRARDGLDRAEAAIAQYEALLDKAKATADAEARVRHLEEAHRLWPTGPRAVELLLVACLEAAEAALKEGRPQDAARYANRALELDPKNRPAEAILDRIEDEPKILAELEGARAELAALRGGAEVSAARYAALATRLQETASRAQNYPDLKKQVDALAKEVSAEQKRWQKMEKHLTEATQSMRSGQWQKGVAALSAGLAALGDEAPVALAEKLQAWQRALDQLQAVEGQLADLWRQAEEGYQGGPEASDFAPALKALDQIDVHLTMIEGTAAAIDAGVPASQERWRQQATDLRLRAEAAREALAQRSAVQGLLILRQATRKWPTDPTLQALDRRLAAQAQDEVATLLRQAKFDLDAGEVTAAEEKLAQAYELQPDNEEIATHYAAVRKRKKLEEKLRAVQTAAAAKLENKSYVAAADELKEGLQILLREADLSEAARSALGDLLSLSEKTPYAELGQAFADDKGWQDAVRLRAELDKLASEGWAVQQAAIMAGQWSGLIREQHLKGYQSTLAAVGQYFQAWLAAVQLRARRPDDPELIENEAKRLAEFIKQCELAAEKRIRNARTFLDQGDYELARNELNDLQKVIQPALDISPSFFEANQATAVLQALEKVEGLKQEIALQASVAEKALPLLEQAEAAYMSGRYADASRHLRSLPDLAPVPRLAQQRDHLQQRLSQARRERAEKTLADALLAARTALGLATSEQELEEVATDLRTAVETPEFDWAILSGDVRSRYDSLLQEVERRKREIAGVDDDTKDAEAEIAHGRFETAQKLLTRAQEKTPERDREKLRVIEKKLRVVAELAWLQANARDQLQRGEGALFQAEPQYQEAWVALSAAQTELQRLQRAIASLLERDQATTARAAVQEQEHRVAALIDLAKAGVSFGRAQEHQKSSETWSEASQECEDAVTFAEEAGKAADKDIAKKADEIKRSAERLRSALQRKQAVKTQLQIELDTVREWLVTGKLFEADAKLKELTRDYPDFSHLIGEVRAQYLRTLNAVNQIERAQSEMRAGNYATALAMVATVLEEIPNFQAALILKRQIEQSEEGNKQLQVALSHAKREEFQQARNALQKAIASGVDEARRQKVEGEIDALEQAARNRAIEPIRTSIKTGDYRKALDECGRVLGRLVSSSFKEEIEALQADAMDRWLEAELRRRAAEDRDQQLHELIETLEFYAKRMPPLAEPQHRAVQRLLREAHARQLRAQLDQVRASISQPPDGEKKSSPPNWEKARSTVNAIISQAEALGLGGVQKDAISLSYEIDEREQEWHKQQARSERDAAMAKAKEIWDHAAGPEDYEAVQKLAQSVLALAEFKNDREARKLLQDATSEIEAYQRTEQSLSQARELVLQRRYPEARTALQIAPVAALLQAQHQTQRQIVEALIAADRAEMANDWRAALDDYQKAVALDGNLAAVVQTDVDRCRSQLMDSVLSQVQAALAELPPNTARAVQLLDQAEADGLIGDSDWPAVRRWRSRIDGLAAVAQAAAILTGPTPDIEDALRLLAGARKALPADEADRSVRDWERLAQAFRHWQAGEIQSAQEAVKAIGAPVSGLPQVRALAITLQEAVQRTERIEQARQDVAQALRQTPPAYAGAVSAVIRLADEVQDPRVDELRASLKRDLKEYLELQRQRNNYQAALELQQQLQELDPADLEARSLAEALAAEREQRFQEAVENALAALENHDLGQARHAYQRAATVAGPAGDSRLASVAQRIAEHEALIQRIDKLLAEADRARLNNDWQGAVGSLEQARDAAPRYKLVQESAAALQRQLAALAEGDLAMERFESAAEKVALARRLAASTELQTLADRIENARQAHAGQRRDRLSAALDQWDLATAEALVAELQDAIGGDVKLRQLRKRFLDMKQASQEIVQAMRCGWAALERREFAQARTAFEQANALVNPSGFAEASAWLAYAANLEAAYGPVAQDQWRKLAGAQEALRRARAAVASSSDTALPAILPEAATKRRNAVAVAAELDRILSQMIQWYRRYEEQAAQLRTDDALDALNQAEYFQREFLRQFRDPLPPGATAADIASERAATGASGRSETWPPTPPAPARGQAPEASVPRDKTTAVSVVPPASVGGPAEQATAPTAAEATSAPAAKPTARRPSGSPAPRAASESNASDETVDAERLTASQPDQKPPEPALATAGPRVTEQTVEEPSDQQAIPAQEEELDDVAPTMVWDMTGFVLPSYDDKE